MNETDLNNLVRELQSRKNLAQRSQDVRAKTGVSATRLAAVIGVQVTTLLRWETGDMVVRPKRLSEWDRAVTALEEFLNGSDPAVTTAATDVREVFDARVHNGLLRSGINTLGEVADLSASDLHKIRNFGKTSVAKVERPSYSENSGSRSCATTCTRLCYSKPPTAAPLRSPPWRLRSVRASPDSPRSRTTWGSLNDVSRSSKSKPVSLPRRSGLC
jgi:DNA-binding XRE family transcriptional regulator